MTMLHNLHFKGILATAAMALFMLLPGMGLGQIAAWDFSGQSSPATFAATTFNSNLVSASGASNITRGAGAAASSASNCFRTTGFANNGIATTNTDYFQITLTAATGYKVSLSTIDAKFGGTATFYASPGVTSQFAYSLDGSTFTLIGSAVQSTSLTMTQISLAGISALQNVASGTTITIRYYASGQTPTGGWGFQSAATAGTNGYAIGGTVAPLTSAPTVASTAVTLINAGGATFNGNISSDGGSAITDRGFCYKTSSGVAISDNKTSEGGTTTGTFSKIFSLSAATNYFYKAYATNVLGTTLAGNEIGFWTLATEPGSYTTSFTNSVISQTEIDLSFDALTSITNATGYLVLQRSGAAPTGLPADGTSYTLGTAIGNGNVVALVTNTSATSAPITGLTPGTQYYYTIFPFNNGANGATYNYKTDGTVPLTNGTTLAALAATSEISGPVSQPTPGTISSLVNSSGAAVRVFDMNAIDYGGDGQPTRITQLTIKTGTGNTATWATAIQGVKLSTDGGSTFVTTGTPTITNSSIVIPVAVGNLSIPDNSTVTLSLYIYLNASPLTDNQVFAFKVDPAASAHGFTADATGSTFLATFASAPASNSTTLTVTATKFNFSVQPSNNTVNTNFSASVEATDANNNRDLDATTSVTLAASAGTLSSVAGLAQNLASGVYAWTDLQNNTPATGVTLSATGSLTTGTSNTFSVYSAQPTLQASAIAFSNVALTSMTISWTNGNGAARMLVGKATGTPTVPVNGTTYAASSAFGAGGTLAPGEFVLYNGTGSTADITGLSGSTTYTFKVFEYNGIGGTENYLTTSNQASQATLGLTYYSNGSGDPAVLTSWKTNRDGSGSSPANFTTGETFVIENGDVMSTTSTWSISGTNPKLWIENGGTLTANNTVTLTATTTFQIDNGGTYIQNVAMAMGSTIFTGTEALAAGSNIEIRILPTGTSAPSAPGWGNLTINQTTSASALGWGGNLSSIQGNLTVLGTGTGSTRHAFTAGTSVTTNIGGNFTVTGGNMWLSSGAGNNTVTVGGNLVINGGTLDLGSSSGVGIINVGGNVTVSSGTLTESGSTIASKIVFNKTGTQTFTGGGTISNNVNFEVGAASVTDLGTGVIAGAGTFNLPAGATLITANTTGLNGSLTLSGNKTLNTAANYTFSGSSAQVTGALLPASVNNLTIDNAAGVTLSNTALTVNGTLTINSGKLLTIEVGKQLTVNGTLSNQAGAAGLVINSDATGSGSLIHSNAGVTGTVQRYIAQWTDDNHGWHLLSSPLASQPIQPGFVPATPDNTQDFYAWDEVNGWWLNSKDPSYQWVPAFDANFVPGKGYLVAYKADVPKSFSGTALNVADVSVSGLTYTNAPTYSGNDITPGWNLLGNPFASAIIWNNGGWSLNNIALVAKIWAEGSASYSDIDIITGGIIPANQGFMVNVLDASGGSLTIPASARTHNTQNWYKSAGKPIIKLAAHNLSAQTAQESVVMFDNQASAAFNPAADSRFLPGYAPQFYSVRGSEHLSTNVLPGNSSQEVIPFSFIKTTGSAYSIEAVNIENVSAQVYLTDLKLDITQNLGDNPVYNFTSVAGDNPARFVLSFGTTGIGGPNANNGGVYAYGNNLYLINPGKARLEVFNLTGQAMLSQDISSEGLYKTGLSVPTGYYVVRVTTGARVSVTKIFIQS